MLKNENLQNFDNLLLKLENDLLENIQKRYILLPSIPLQLEPLKNLEENCRVLPNNIYQGICN